MSDKVMLALVNIGIGLLVGTVIILGAFGLATMGGRL